MACRHPAGTTAPPPPVIRHPPRRRPRWTARARSPSRTAACAHAAPPAADQVSASVTGPPCPSAGFVPPSHLLTIEVLRRPVESAQYLAIRYTERLAEAGAVTSVGSRGDSLDNARGD